MRKITMEIIEKLKKQRDNFRVLNNRIRQWEKIIVPEDYTKCITSLAVGIAEIKEMLPLNNKICNILRKELPINNGKFSKYITVKYFLPMGLEQHISYLMRSQSICRAEIGDIK